MQKLQIGSERARKQTIAGRQQNILHAQHYATDAQFQWQERKGSLTPRASVHKKNPDAGLNTQTMHWELRTRGKSLTGP